MIPLEMQPYAPYVALALGIALGAGGLFWLVARKRVHTRPILLTATIVAALPVLYMGLVWTRVVPEAYVRFGRPWATLLGLVAMAFIAVRLASRTTRTSRLRRWLGDGLLSLAVLACAIAATSPELGRPLDRLTVVVVIDRSRSIDLVPAASTRVKRELSFAETSMHDDDLIGTVVFATNAATEDPPRNRSELSSPQKVDIGRDGTDIAGGLKRALADVPADSAARLVLISDGVATRGDVMSAAAAAVASEIPIDVLALDQREIPDVRVVSFRVPPRAAEGETLGMRLVVSSPADAAIEIRLKRDGEIVQRLQAKVAAGEDVLTFPEPAGASGLHRYDVEITAKDERLDETADDNTASAFVRVRGPARALVIDGNPDATGFMTAALEAAGFRVEAGGLSSLPAGVGGMARYDLIVFGDIPAHDLRVSQIEGLASYARDLGGGLVLTGGDASFGPGGYARTALEDVSPVSFDLKQEKRRASLAEVIAIDISGSMGAQVGGQTKLELANEAAYRSADLLGGGDQLGVVHVDTAPHWAVPLQPVKDKKAIEQAIRSVGPGGGGIFCDVALREAYAALNKSTVNLKHVLLFADGADAENITPAVQAQVEAAFKSGITTSCVSLGRGPDSAALEDLSNRGGGRFYIAEDATRLPAVFAQETVLASRSAISDKPFQVALSASHGVTKGVDVDEAPALGGYVITIPKALATTVLSGPDDDPVLALGIAGMGRTAAFTSDLKDRWGSAWTDWEGAARLLVQTARHVSRREDDSRVRLQADASGGQLHLRATVVDDDGRLTSFRRLRVSVNGPDGFKRDVPLEAAGAGTYSATVPLSRHGAYIAVARDEVAGVPVATTGAVLTAGEELRPTGTDHALLSRIAELTGGKRRDTLAGIFNDRAGRRFAYRDITMALVLVAAFAFLLAIAARRLALPEGLLAGGRRAMSWRPWHRGQDEGEAAPAGTAAQATLDHLLASRHKEATAPEAEVADASTGATGAAGAAEATGAAATRDEEQAGSPAVAPSAAEKLAARRAAPREAAPAPVAPPVAPPPEAPEFPEAPPVTPTPAVAPKRARSAPQPEATAEGERPLTAAEILLARRKRNKKE
ncbi:MAG: VWA domain-containing protein [Polyangiaceae bacterium]